MKTSAQNSERTFPTLTSRIAEEGTLQAPGVFDALSARLAENAGFNAVYMTGLGATASRLGLPDLGLMSGYEMADHARNIVRSAGVPVIADADNGYGGHSSIERTVGDFAHAGVSAIHLEDQVTPKRCGQLDGVKVMDFETSLARVFTAVTTAATYEMELIARTDAIKPLGVEAAIERARAFLDAGADFAFVDGISTHGHLEAVAEGLEGPKVIALVAGTEIAETPYSELADMGFGIILYPLDALFASIGSVGQAFAALKSRGHSCSEAEGSDYSAYADSVGLSRHQGIDDAAASQARRYMESN
jgi:2-methylisocitrate lyase-like PEP mutase family enzyme